MLKHEINIKYEYSSCKLGRHMKCYPGNLLTYILLLISIEV